MLYLRNNPTVETWIFKTFNQIKSKFNFLKINLFILHKWGRCSSMPRTAGLILLFCHGTFGRLFDVSWLPTLLVGLESSLPVIDKKSYLFKEKKIDCEIVPLSKQPVPCWPQNNVTATLWVINGPAENRNKKKSYGELALSISTVNNLLNQHTWKLVDSLSRRKRCDGGARGSSGVGGNYEEGDSDALLHRNPVHSVILGGMASI